ncbi:unnamed protein product [Symbiodinium sp. CCMP2592]|nr:unnamed protein product [Symbiodinium sp. CCMP2592]CAE7364421.1 unnamed protein product [Symbiodinium sp. CCMP2592]
MASAIRKKPNCFNLVHQIVMVKKMKCEDVGSLEDWFHAWEHAAKEAEAYRIGSLESKAALQLLTAVDGPVFEKLSDMVRTYGMNKILNHEPIADGLFNRDYCAASGQLKPWADILSNTPQSLELTLHRMEEDYKNLHVKMRKPFASKDVEPQRLHSTKSSS